MLYGADGQALDLAPSPNPLTEERVNAELRQLDSLLFIAWMPVAYIAPNGRHEGRYALCYRWHSEDKRWTALPGTANEGPYDIMGWF